MPSRSLDDLEDDVKAMALAFKAECKRRGLDVLIYCTLRSNKEQDALYSQGRSSNSSHIVTNARAGQSLHNPQPATGKARAFDAVPIRKDGKLEWDNAKALAAMGECGIAVGLEWAGKWATFKERVHFQKKAKP